MSFRDYVRILFSLAVLAFSGSAHAAETAVGDGPGALKYHELRRLALGGDGGWDYLAVDAEARRLYIARANRVMVIDADSGQLTNEIPGLDGAHGVALVKEEGRGFATSGKTGEVVAFDLQTFRPIGKVKAGENPDAIVYDPSAKRLFAFNGKSRNATAIDPATLKVLGTLALSGKPEFAAADGHGHVFVNLEDKSQLATIDSKSLKVTARHALAPCEEPTGLSMDTVSNRLIVGCGNKLAAIVDGTTGKVLQSFPVGDGVDATAFDAKRSLAFVSAGEGKLTVLRETKGKFHAQQEVTTVQGARTLAVDEKSGQVFLPIAQFVKTAAAPGAPRGGHVRPSVVPNSFAVLVEGADNGP